MTTDKISSFLNIFLARNFFNLRLWKTAWKGRINNQLSAGQLVSWLWEVECNSATLQTWVPFFLFLIKSKLKINVKIVFLFFFAYFNFSLKMFLKIIWIVFLILFFHSNLNSIWLLS
jgi:hypothetical protein